MLRGIGGRLFSGASGGGNGDDIEHSNMLVRYIANCLEFGADGWTIQDASKLKSTLLDSLWNQDRSLPQFSRYMLGNLSHGSWWMQGGWFSLGMNDHDVQKVIQNKRPWTTNYWSQHFGHLMRNASSLGAI